MDMATTGVDRISDAPTERSITNVGDIERAVSIVSGSALAVYGLQRRDLRGLALAGLGAMLFRRGASGHCNVYDALGVSTADDLTGAAATVDARRAIKIERSVAIDRPPETLYSIWHNFERIPDYVREIESVRLLGEGRSHWVACAPGDKRIEWDAEIVNDLPNELIAWKTVGNPDIAHAGSVHFTRRSDGRGTDMRVVIDYEPPGGRLGMLVSKFTRLFGQAPEARIVEDLQAFKRQVEAGKAATI